jgi:cbb3-type cytochrome c oxidase subunit III
LLLACGIAYGEDAPKTVWDGVYTEAQALRGQAAYSAMCSECHKTTLEGNPEAPPLKGIRFVEVWREYRLEALYHHVSTRMPRRPRGEPGTLPERTYLDILAYILENNSFPPGSSELTANALPHIILVGKDGPKPIASGSAVMAVGCLAATGEDAWALVQATDPERTRNPDETSPEELKHSTALKPGSHTYRLTNLMDFKEGFRPELFKDKRVQAKGVLIRQTKEDRISVMSLEAVGESCVR